MKAVVMAGGQGTRLRPLTSNQPKPMVPIVNKPCIQHILELVQRHGINEAVMTLAFLPRLIRNHFGDGSSLGMHIDYTVEETPAGTAGSIRLAKDLLDETFLVISGDALTDFDLTKVINFHKEREAMVTIALTSVENPLEFGVVIVDDQGRIQRFLEKPGWGQVFSDTVNTGIYVLEPEIFDHIPEGQPYDFSHDLFPKLFEMKKPLYGMVCEGYWQDVGSLEQYVAANRDALDGKIKLTPPGVRLRGNIWVGKGAQIDSLDDVEGPAVIGENVRVDPGRPHPLAHRAGGQHRGAHRFADRGLHPGAERVRSLWGSRQWCGAHGRGGSPREREHRSGRRGGRQVGHRPQRGGGQQREDLPAQEHRAGVGRPFLHRLGDPRRQLPLRSQRRAGACQRGRHPGDGHAPRHVLRHAHRQGLLCHHQPRHAPRLPGVQARHHQRPELHGRERPRPHHGASRRQPLRPQERQRHRRHPRADEPGQSRGHRDPLLRGARRAHRRQAGAGHREPLLPRGLPQGRL